MRSTSEPPCSRHASTHRRSTSTLLNVGMTTESRGELRAPCIRLQVEGERRENPRGHQTRRTVHEQARAAGQTPAYPRGRRKLRHADLDADRRETQALERNAQRRRRKMTHVHK